MSKKVYRNALPMGYELHWYQIEDVLGQGGFGLTYLARDINLERMVAIKEYMPSQISMRDNEMHIQPLSKEEEEDYKWGLERFISEARVLTKFDHPSLVKVFNVFEANNSAYMVMNYEQGKSLRELLKGGYTFTEDELVNLLFPLMDGLEIVHNVGFVHRDIKPGNVFIRSDGGPVLLDFGSARQTRGTFSTMTVTNFVSPGYAPIEQYTGKSDRQGPWTDIYGLGATAYELITGNMPEAAIDRSAMISDDAGDNLIKLSMICKENFSPKLLAAIDHALAFNIQDRPQTIVEWREEFGIDKKLLKTLMIPEAHVVTNIVTTPTEVMTRKTDVAPSPKEEETYPATENMAGPPPSLEPLDTPLPKSPRQLFKTFILVTTAIGVITVTFVGYHSYLWISQNILTPVPETGDEIVIEEALPVIEEAVVEEAIIETPVVEEVAAEEVVVSEAIVPAIPSTEEMVAELLEQAREDVLALRLTTPDKNSAYDKYLSVLALNPGNVDAIRGIDTITDKYLQLVYTDINTGDFERAKSYMEKAELLSPGTQRVRTARVTLDNAIFERNKPKNVIDKLKGFF